MALSTFKYKPRDPDAWEKRSNQQGGDFIGVINADFKTFTPAKGDNFVRILPPTWEAAPHYGLDLYVHYGIGPDRASVLCLLKMKGERCPICEAKQRADRAGDEELSKELSASRRVAVWMVDRKDESKGPMIWVMPWTLDRDFTKAARDKDSGELYELDNPEEGYNISFERTGERLLTKYIGVQVARKTSAVDQAYIDFIVLEPLPNTLIWMSYDEIKTLYEGGADGAEEPEPTRKPAAEKQEADAKPAGGQWKPRGKAAPAQKEPEPEADEPVEEPDEPEPAEEPEEPEPERKPTVKPATKPAAGETAASAKSTADALRARFKNR